MTSATRSEMSLLEPCSHEEADTRIMVHVLDACSSGHKRIMIWSNDTDVVVLAISVVESLPAKEIWITYGTGKNLKYLAVHEMAKKLGHKKSRALPMFHSLTGCDTVSFFGGRGTEDGVGYVECLLRPERCSLYIAFHCQQL